VTGNVKADDIFALCEKYFGPVKKQLPLNVKKTEPDIFAHQVELEEMSIDFPVQIYSYVIPSPAFGHKDYYTFNFLMDILFSNSNSLLNKRIVNTNLAYQINGGQYDSRMYSNYSFVDIIMKASMGNAKVKKEISREINGIINEGLEESDLKNYISNLETDAAFMAYSNNSINGRLGFAEYYYNDYNRYDAALEEYKKIKPDDLKQIAQVYFNPEKMKVINIKPIEQE
jgi:zinc protease